MINEIQSFCMTLPFVESEIKWDNDLVFSVKGKMFAICSRDDGEPRNVLAIKLDNNITYSFIDNENIIPAPYLGRYGWISFQNEATLTKHDWQGLIMNSYKEIVKKLKKKEREEINAAL